MESYSDLVSRQEKENMDFLMHWNNDKAKLIEMGRDLDAQKIDEHYAAKHNEMKQKHTQERNQFFEQEKSNQKYTHPVTGREMTKAEWDEMQDYVNNSKERGKSKSNEI